MHFNSNHELNRWASQVFSVFLLVAFSFILLSSLISCSGRRGNISVDEITGEQDLLEYKISKQEAARNLRLHRIDGQRFAVVSDGNDIPIAISYAIDDPDNPNTFSTFLIEFTGSENRHIDTFTREILEREFVAKLSVPENSAEFAWKNERLFLSTLLSRHDFGIFRFTAETPEAQEKARKWSDFFCNRRCLDSGCAGCMRALCNYFKCKEADIFDRCLEEGLQVQASCVGLGIQRAKE